MMGKDCERILSGINEIKDSLSELMLTITGTICTPIKIKADHNHSLGSYNTFEFDEKSSDNDLSSVMDLINSKLSVVLPDIEQMKSLGSSMYTGTKTFNNSYGSPWTEIDKLEEALNNIKNLDMSCTKLIGGKLIIIGLINSAIVSAVDAKWAIITYHDYIQRGYDAKVNNNTPDITFLGADREKTIGNIKQNFKENVNIPEESIEVF